MPLDARLSVPSLVRGGDSCGLGVHGIEGRSYYRVVFRKRIYHTLGKLLADLETWLHEYNEQRPHQDR